MGLCISATSAAGAVILMMSGIMSNDDDDERKGQTVCSLEAEVEINAYIQIASAMSRRIADAHAKVAEYDAVAEPLADEFAQKFGTRLTHEVKNGM